MRLEHVSKSFDGRRVLDDLSYGFRPGVTAITGPSGVGKSTLINLLLGLARPDTGRIERGAGRLAAVFQEDRLIEHLTAEGNLRFVTGGRGDGAARALLTALGLGDDLDKPVSEFSGGMKRRVAIARALIVRPDVLVMDEPFRGLDAQARVNAARVILEARPERLIFVTHDPVEIELLGATDVLRLEARGGEDER